MSNKVQAQGSKYSTVPSIRYKPDAECTISYCKVSGMRPDAECMVSYCKVSAETLYHRDVALLYIAYVMLIWAAPIPADRWHCRLWP